MISTLEELPLVHTDDHAVVRIGRRMLLEGAGAPAVAEAASGALALAAFAEHKSDALPTDISMPGIGGLGARKNFPPPQP